MAKLLAINTSCCPRCGGDLEATAVGDARCAACGHQCAWGRTALKRLEPICPACGRVTAVGERDGMGACEHCEHVDVFDAFLPWKAQKEGK